MKFIKLFANFKALHLQHCLSVGGQREGTDEMMPWGKQSLDKDGRREWERKQGIKDRAPKEDRDL